MLLRRCKFDPVLSQVVAVLSVHDHLVFVPSIFIGHGLTNLGGEAEVGSCELLGVPLRGCVDPIAPELRSQRRIVDSTFNLTGDVEDDGFFQRVDFRRVVCVEFQFSCL